MNSVPLTVLSFFFLSLLYFIAFIASIFVMCKFPKFIKECKIAKYFYVAIAVACVVRSGAFGVTTGLYVKFFKANMKLQNNADYDVSKACAK